MEGRARVRSYLLARSVDRPPVVPFATELTARLAQVEPDELFSDPNLLTQAFLECRAACGFDCVVLTVPVDAIVRVTLGIPMEAESRLGVVLEGVRRLRALLGEGAALALVYPGPRKLASALGRPSEAKDLEELTAKVLEVAGYLEAPSVDVFGILESDPVGWPEAALLAEALAPMWNTARYYSAPSLFACARAGAEIARIGAGAVVAWEGVRPDDLLAAGAPRVGVPVVVGDPLPPLPEGGFYTTRGEIRAHTEVALIRRFLSEAEAGSAGGGPRAPSAGAPG